MTLTSRYVKYARQELKVRPILPFGLPLSLGTVGVVEDDQFHREGTTASILGQEPGESTRTVKPVQWSGVSGRHVSVNFRAAGEASQLFPQAPTASARVDVHFARSGAFLLSVHEAEFAVLADPFQLLQSMVAAYQRGVWRKDFVLVTEVVTPLTALVLISRASDTKLLLEADAEVTPAKLVDLAGHVSITQQSEDVLRLDGGGGPCFFNAYRVKQSFWSQIDSAVPFEETVTPENAFEQV